MGSCCTSTDDNTKFIEGKLDGEYQKDKKINKLLFLGPGRSGKSTIFKQLKWLHSGGFTSEDCYRLKSYVNYHVISQMRAAIAHYGEKRGADTIKDTTLLQAMQTLEDLQNVRTLTSDIAAAISYIWKNDTVISGAFSDEEVSKYQILDETTQYFWDQMDRIAADDYVPNETDIINVRYKTTGVVDEKFHMGNVRFHVFDVGGQQSERKKWIHCFVDVNALVFVISLSSYNEQMYEDRNKNCMVDGLELFQEVISNKHFGKTHIILFLNKTDLFKKKVERDPITVCPAFADFVGYDSCDTICTNPNDYSQTTQYVKHKFISLNKDEAKQIYTHFTYARDRSNVDKVFLDVKGIIVNNNLASLGLSPV